LWPGILFSEGTRGRIDLCNLSESEMSAIAIRSGSVVVIQGTHISKAKHFGISISDQSKVLISMCTIFESAQSAICCYNHAEVTAVSSQLVGPGRVGVNVFTGGFADIKDCSIKGMSDVAIWIRLAGVGAFSEITVVPPRGHRFLALSAIAGVPFGPPTRKEVLKCESKRPVSVRLKGAIEVMRLNLLRSKAQPGRDATKPHCKICKAEAGDCMFMPCTHVLYCSQCWKRLDPKPTECELCYCPIMGVVAPRDCSREGEPDDQCGICCSRPVDSVIVPCGHMLCGSCGVKCFNESTECPFCRAANACFRNFVSYQ
jgi:hypothetical protein